LIKQDSREYKENLKNYQYLFKSKHLILQKLFELKVLTAVLNYKYFIVKFHNYYRRSESDKTFFDKSSNMLKII
jgi:hypothetical protein